MDVADRRFISCYSDLLILYGVPGDGDIPEVMIASGSGSIDSLLVRHDMDRQTWNAMLVRYSRDSARWRQVLAEVRRNIRNRGER